MNFHVLLKDGIVVLATAFMVVGCDKVNQVGAILADEPLTIVLAPGALITVNGTPVSLRGFEKCPQPNPAFYTFIGSGIPTVDAPSCALISANTTVVSVSLALPSGPITEHWTVTRENRKISLRRPDGSLVGENTH